MHLERDAGLYTTLPYYIVQYIYNLGFSVFTTFFQLLIMFTFSGLPWGHFPYFFIIGLTGFFMLDAVLFLLAYAGKSLDGMFLYFNFTIGLFKFANGYTMN